MKVKWLIAVLASLLPSPMAAQEGEKLWFFIRCQFDADAKKLLVIHLEVAPSAAISTFDPTNLLGGAIFAKSEMPKFDDDRHYLAFRTAPEGGEAWTLMLQSKLPRDFRDGRELTNGILARSGEQSPRETGICINIRTDQAKEFFDHAVATWKSK